MPDQSQQTVRVKHDHFPTVLGQCRYIVAVLFPTTLETGDSAIAQEIARGVYHFTAYKPSRRFVTACNSGLDEPVAYLFRNENTLHDAEDDDDQ